MPLDDDDKSKMVELAAMGYSQKAIAKRFGISPQYVSTILTAVVERAQEARRAARTKQDDRSAPKAPKTARRRTTA